MKKIALGFILCLAVVITIAATRRPIVVEGSTMIQRGTALVTTTDGTVTQAFTTAFSSVPTLIVTAVGSPNAATNEMTVTTSNFVLKTKASGTNNWIAVGTP
jgi:hypothetical protein